MESEKNEEQDIENNFEKKIISDDQIESSYFGYNYFEGEYNFFDNIPVPKNYLLGPGDEIIISMWGETNLRETFLINNEGSIFVENVGFVNLANNTIDEAEKLLKYKLKSVFSTIDDNSTNLMIELGRLKSLNIFISGEVNKPGIHLIHPFSDVFTSLIQAGGVKKEGSLRAIEILRDDVLVGKVDLYDFFINGKKMPMNVKLLDGDVINVPSVQNRIEILGEVNRPGFYEMLSSDNVSNLVNYAAGFTALASTNLIIESVIPINERTSDDIVNYSFILNIKDLQSINLGNGSIVEVKKVVENFSKATVFGRVKYPGPYPALKSSLRDILNVAGGFDDPIFRKTINDDEIIILRKDSNQFYSQQFIISYEDSDNFKIEIDDKIFVYENINYRNSFTYRIEGEVNKPGTYPLFKGITLGQAISTAGGLTELATENNIIINQEFTEIDENGETITTVESVADAKLNFEITKDSVIKVLQFENVVRIEGNVYNPGLIAIDKNISLARAIELAGGYKPNSLIKRTYVKRANGDIQRNDFLRGRVRKVYPGDTIFVPENPNPSDFEIGNFLSNLSTSLANIAAILVIVDNNNN